MVVITIYFKNKLNKMMRGILTLDFILREEDIDVKKFYVRSLFLRALDQVKKNLSIKMRDDLRIIQENILSLLEKIINFDWTINNADENFEDLVYNLYELAERNDKLVKDRENIY